MTNTPNYNLNLVEGADLVNPLTQVNPNFTAIDTAMAANRDKAVQNATEVVTGTIHAISRAFAGNIFKFTATGAFHAGDTFTLDGNPIGAEGVDGNPLPEGAYDNGSNVLCIVGSGVLTIITNTSSAQDLSAYMRTADYVGSGAQYAVQNAEVAVSAGTAANASALNNQPASFYAPAASVAGLLQNIQTIAVVNALPAVPDANTLYLIIES